MIKASLNGRIGRELTENGFLSLAINQYKKGAENNRFTTWVDVWVPTHLREKVSKLAKGTSVLVDGSINFEKDEYEGNVSARAVMFADSIQKYIGANGQNYVFIRGARLGKDPMPTKNGGYMFNVASNQYRNGEELTTWVTVFIAPKDAERVNALGIQKGRSIDLVSDRFEASISNDGYLNVTLNAVQIGYGATSPKSEENGNPDEKATQGNSAAPNSQQSQGFQPVNDESFDDELFDMDSLDNADGFFF